MPICCVGIYCAIMRYSILDKDVFPQSLRFKEQSFFIASSALIDECCPFNDKYEILSYPPYGVSDRTQKNIMMESPPNDYSSTLL